MKEWFKSEINKCITTLVQRGFWLFVSTSVFFYLLISYADFFFTYKNLLIEFKTNVVLAGASFFALVVLALFAKYVGLSLQLNKQDLHRKPSWVFYIYWGTVNSFLVYALYISYFDLEFYWVPLVAALIVLLIKLLNEWLGEKPNISFKEFASGAVGKDDDNLDFKIPAQNAAKGFSGLKNYVDVVAVYGGMGFGKSSFARMIIESLDVDKTLYTYISLTETNEAKDFSKLFAERWMATLSERYPKIDIALFLPSMEPILRESGNGFFSGVLSVLSVLNPGLHKTKTACSDVFSYREKFVSDRVGKLFGNITEIEQKTWVIAIDEIERAQLDEIYRLVEIIERFRYEGRTGLPIKLIFLLCVSEPDLQDYLKNFESQDSRAYQLGTFFYNDPKSITQRIYLPAVDIQRKYEFIKKKLVAIAHREGLVVPDLAKAMVEGDPTRAFMNAKDAADYVMSLLSAESPRVISRIEYSLDFFFGTFRDIAGDQQKDTIRYFDIVALEYVKIKYPYLIDFFIHTIDVIVDRNFGSYLLRKDLENKKIDILKWIENSTGYSISPEDGAGVMKILGLVMYSYIDFFNPNYESKSKIEYYGTSSYPELMRDYLSLVANKTDTTFKRNNIILNQHKLIGDDVVKGLEDKQLVDYALFVYHVPNAAIQLSLDLLAELVVRVVDGRFRISPMNVGDTIMDDAMYRIAYHILLIVEKDAHSTDEPSQSIATAFDSLTRVLGSKAVSSGLKFALINSLMNNDMSSRASIHSRFEAALGKLQKYYREEILDLVTGVFNEFHVRYLIGDSVLYENEENFFFTLYQGWSGLSDNEDEIEMIRNAAKRGLSNYPEAIRLYWSKYPYEEGWKSLDDLYANTRFSMGDTNNPLYMPLQTLIFVTRDSHMTDEDILVKMVFWEKVMNDPRIKEMSKVKSDNTTLKAILSRRGLLY